MTQAVSSNRYWTIDSLRGIAATAVALYHINLATLSGSGNTAIGLLKQVFDFGYLGVAIFFVISGFVISASTSRDTITFRYFGKFMVKRQLRLDPAYWTSIALDVVLATIAVRYLMANTPLPDFKTIVAHVFYVQDIVGIRNIAAIYWTLCLEIQFYIVFCLVLAIDTSSRRTQRLASVDVRMWLFAILTLYSMLVAAGALPSPWRGLFVPFWIFFALGAAAFHWGVREQGSSWRFPLFAAAMLVVFLCQLWREGIAVSLNLGIACATAILLYAGARRAMLGSWLRNRALQYLGERSYSIYLFHTIVGERAVGVTTQVIYPRLGVSALDPLWVACAFVVGVAASLVMAEIAYRCVEVPSLLLSKRIRPNEPTTIVSDLRGSRRAVKPAAAVNEGAA